MNAATTNMGSLTGQTCALQARCKGFNSPGLHWQALPWSNGQGATVRRWKWRFDSFWEYLTSPWSNGQGATLRRWQWRFNSSRGYCKARVPWLGRPLS